ncbi:MULTISPECIES: WXG100 family type VII secretion target [Micromonosporaceae]|uniref:Proteins of 100 residues with WXG n=1 Tax=Micromonospora eburnea TaxID=227316 RepID=A0A1C6VB49_9ACTN|nr:MULTISPECIES: WXG100 family type VII secretion target [Micromonospora]SCL63100.1 Proteins of 100 residues with WXG [Micromonospora eburnea]
MPMIGGELDQLAALKATFDRQAGMVADVLSTIRSQLGNTYWEGPAASRFRESWQSDFEPMLQRLQQQMGEAGAEIARRRDALMKAGS